MDKFSNRLEELMNEKGINQSQLAKEIKISQQAISRYLKNERTPDVFAIIKFAKYFGVSADYLLGLEN